MNRRLVRLLGYLAVFLFMAGTSLLVGILAHPELPLLAPAHLLQAGITAFVAVPLFHLLISYADRMTRIAEELSRTNRTLRQQTSRDSLTGLYNHRYFQDMLRHEYLLARRHQADLSCMMLDLDHFKEVNDICGHPFGDLVLQGTAEQILHEARKTDTAARYGGEEFAVLLPNTDLAGALRIAERIRKRAEKQAHRNGLHSMQVTISIGQASVRAHGPDTPEQLLIFADRALYQAKAAGRNRVLSYSAAS